MIGEIIISFLALVALLILAGLTVSGWITFLIVRAIFRGLFGALGFRSHRPVTANSCTRALCRAENPPGARYCRRCGKQLPAGPFLNARPVESVVVR